MDAQGRPTDIIEAMLELFEFFRPRLSDLSTFQELEDLARHHEKWRNAYALFRKIRSKTLKAIKKKDGMRETQYCFEEICAKTLYNLSEGSPGCAPFDDDSPFWILPLAASLAQAVGVDDIREISWLLRPPDIQQ
jgi:hypothetical protein